MRDSIVRHNIPNSQLLSGSIGGNDGIPLLWVIRPLLEQIKEHKQEQ